MSEEHLINNCAPTLAGLKTGSLFICPYESGAAVRDYVRRMNRQLSPKGLRLVPLRYSEKRVMLYLYRPGLLHRDLQHETAGRHLRCQGYDTRCCGKCLRRLKCRLAGQESFPHEIGFFLGYPPEDVEGFIVKGPSSGKGTGLWKVYGDLGAAEKRFRQLDCCTRAYRQLWETGRSLDRLAVSL